MITKGAVKEYGDRSVGLLPRLSDVLFELRGRDNPPTSLHRTSRVAQHLHFLPTLRDQQQSLAKYQCS